MYLKRRLKVGKEQRCSSEAGQHLRPVLKPIEDSVEALTTVYCSLKCIACQEENILRCCLLGKQLSHCVHMSVLS